MKIPAIEISDGNRMPAIGLGTWQLKGEECTRAVASAIGLGYTHIDTAEIYGNHEAIGKAIANIPRKNLFITSKVPHDRLKEEEVIRSCEEALQELGTEYLDLFLIHWPSAEVPLGETFRAMARLREERKVRSVGVSNFTVKRLAEALEATDIPIVVNQVEYHPYLNQEDLRAFCEEKGVRIVAYSPIARGKILDDPIITAIADRHQKTAVQVTLRWLTQKGLVAIPKSSSEDHLRENMEIFDFSLDDEEMGRIDAIEETVRIISPHFAEF